MILARLALSNLTNRKVRVRVDGCGDCALCLSGRLRHQRIRLG